LAEEGDYLSGTCGDKDFAQRVEAESEQRARAATMVFDRNGMQARHGDAGFDGERHGEGEQREQGAEFVLSVVDFPAVADRDDDDRGIILNEDRAPIADPKTATTAAEMHSFDETHIHSHGRAVLQPFKASLGFREPALEHCLLGDSSLRAERMLPNTDIRPQPQRLSSCMN
jgi:hypothetical protein